MWYLDDPTICLDNPFYFLDGTGPAAINPPPKVAPEFDSPQPQNFAAVAVGQSVVLTWDQLPNVLITGYRIYRNGVAYDTVGVVGTYSDTRVKLGYHYDYAVASFDVDLDEGPQSPRIRVDVLQGTNLNFQVSYEAQPGGVGVPANKIGWQ